MDLLSGRCPMLINITRRGSFVKGVPTNIFSPGGLTRGDLCSTLLSGGAMVEQTKRLTKIKAALETA